MRMYLVLIKSEIAHGIFDINRAEYIEYIEMGHASGNMHA